MGRKYGTTQTSGRKYNTSTISEAEQLGYKPKTDSPTALDRLFGLLSAAETGSAAYSFLEGKDPLKQYATDVSKGVTLQGMGGKKTYSDVLGKLGVPEGAGRSLAGVGLDILLDPTTYFGGFLAKQALKGTKVVGGVATKIPKVRGGVEAVQDLLVPGAKLKRTGQMGQEYWDDFLKLQKGTRGEQTKMIKNLGEQFKNLETLGIKKESLLAAEKGIKEVPQEVKPIVDLLSEWGGEEAKRGLLKSNVENYIPHILSKEGREFVTQGKLDLMGISKPLRAKLGSAKERKLLGTIEEINKHTLEKHGIKLFEEEPFKIMAQRGVDSVRAVNTYDFLQNTIKKFGIQNADDVPSTTLKGINYIKSSLPAAEKVLLPEQIAKHLDETYKFLTNDESINGVLKGYDQILNFWKGSVTGYFPAFHTRNAIGGIYNNFLAGVKNPLRYSQAHDIALGKAGKLVLDNKAYSFDDLRDLMTKSGVFGQTGIIDVVERPEDIIHGAKGLSKIRDLPRGVMGFIEDRMRGALFIDRLSKGDDGWSAAKEVIKFHFDYMPEGLTTFEKTVMKRLVPFYCVPTDTEALSKEGWKKHNEIFKGDDILTYKDGELVWGKVEDVATFDYSGQLMSLSNSFCDFLATFDHRWVVRMQDGREKIVKGYKLRSNHKIPLTGKYQANESILSARDAAILGWLVTDGYTRWRKGYLEAMIYQSPKKYANEIRELLDKDCTSESIHPDSGVICFRLRGKCLENIKKYFRTKADLMNIVTRLDITAMEAMRDSMFKAEGNTNITFRFFAQDTKNPFVRDAFQFLSQVLGEPINLNGRGGYIKKHKYLKVSGIIGVQQYKGKIWCPKTTNGTWLMRRNGKIIVTGNTWLRNNIPLQITQAFEQPAKVGSVGKILRQLRGDTERYEDEYKALPDYIKQGFPIRLQEKERGKPEYLYGMGLPLEDVNRIKSKTGLDVMTPIIKYPLERLTNKNFYLNQDINKLNAAPQIVGKFPEPIKNFLNYDETKRDGKVYRTVDPYKWHFITSAVSRGLFSMDKLTDPNFANTLKLLYLGVGMKVKPVDIQKEKYFRTREEEERQNQFLESRGKLKNYEIYYQP